MGVVLPHVQAGRENYLYARANLAEKRVHDRQIPRNLTRSHESVPHNLSDSIWMCNALPSLLYLKPGLSLSGYITF